MLGRSLPDFAPVPRPPPGPEYRPAPPPLLPGQPKRRTRGPNKVRKAAPVIMEAFPWSNPEEDFLTRLLIKIEALIQVDGEVITWRKDVRENFPKYKPVPVPGERVQHLFLKDAVGVLHKFSPLEVRFAYFTRRFPHDVRLVQDGPAVLSGGAQKRYWALREEAEASGREPEKMASGRSRLKDFSIGNLTQNRYPTVEHRPLIPQRNQSGFMRLKPVDPLAWKYSDRYRPCYVDLVHYGDPLSVVRICSHNFWVYKGDTECEIEWQKLDADVRSDLLRTNLQPGMFIRVLSRDLGAMSVKGYMKLHVMPTIYGEKELRGPEDVTYDAGWLKIKGGRPRRAAHGDGRRLKGRKPEDQPDRPAHITSAQDFSPVPKPEDDPDFADQLWRKIEDESFYPPGHRPDPRYAPRFYAVDPLKLGLHPWQAEVIRLQAIELAKEI